jgi:hypothetical protein
MMSVLIYCSKTTVTLKSLKVDAPDPDDLTTRTPISLPEDMAADNDVVAAPIVEIGRLKVPTTEGVPDGDVRTSTLKFLEASTTSTCTVTVVSVEATATLSPAAEHSTPSPVLKYLVPATGTPTLCVYL